MALPSRRRAIRAKPDICRAYRAWEFLRCGWPMTRRVSTALPATMALAATFSLEDAQSNGVVIGRDARALGIDLVLEPFINIYRDPGFSRAYNTYGEDPLLSGL